MQQQHRPGAGPGSIGVMVVGSSCKYNFQIAKDVTHTNINTCQQFHSTSQLMREPEGWKAASKSVLRN